MLRAHEPGGRLGEYERLLRLRGQARLAFLVARRACSLVCILRQVDVHALRKLLENVKESGRQFRRVRVVAKGAVPALDGFVLDFRVGVRQGRNQ